MFEYFDENVRGDRTEDVSSGFKILGSDFEEKYDFTSHHNLRGENP